MGTFALYLWSRAFGLFGFREVSTGAGLLAAILEITTFVGLGRVASAGLRPGNPAGEIRMALAGASLLLLFGAESVPGAAGASIGHSPAGQSATAGYHRMDMDSMGAAGGPAKAAKGNEVTIVIKNFMFHPADPAVRPGPRTEPASCGRRRGLGSTGFSI